MTKQMVKFGAGALALVVIGYGALYVIRSYIPEYQARKAYEKLIEEYKNDPYGGDTPEETMRLFIEALKKGDIELASKYYVWDKQNNIHKKLQTVKETDKLTDVIERLERLTLTKKDDRQAFFTLIDEHNHEVSEIIVQKQSINQRWKITEL